MWTRHLPGGVHTFLNASILEHCQCSQPDQPVLIPKKSGFVITLQIHYTLDFFSDRTKLWFPHKMGLIANPLIDVVHFIRVFCISVDFYGISIQCSRLIFWQVYGLIHLQRILHFINSLEGGGTPN